MTTKEAATFLGVSVSRVKILIRQGRIRAEKHGRDWWIDERSLKTYMEKRK